MRIFQNNEMRIRAHTFISTITVETLESALVIYFGFYDDEAEPGG